MPCPPRSPSDRSPTGACQAPAAGVSTLPARRACALGPLPCVGQSFGLKARFPLSLALMKKIIVLLAVAACLLAVPALAVKTKAKPSAPAHKAVEGSSETVNVPGKILMEPNAFHGIKWGTPMAAIPDLTLVEKAGQATYATVHDVVYRIGDAFLSNMVYAFCQDKFAAVMVDYKGRKAHDTIKNFLVSKYTTPLQVTNNADNLAWPIGNVLIRMEYNAATELGSLSYFYQPLYDPCNATAEKAKQ